MPEKNLLRKAQALAKEQPSGDKIKLYKRLCSCLQEKLQKTLTRVESYGSTVLQYTEVLEELCLLVQKVKTFADDCCYGNHGINFVLAAIQVTTHKQRFSKYHVDLDWCMSLVARLGGQCAHSEEFDSEHMTRLVLEDTLVRSQIVDDERELKNQLEAWIAKRGEHQAICWILLRRLGLRAPDIMPDHLGAPPITYYINSGKCKRIGSGGFGDVYEINWYKKQFAVKDFKESVFKPSEVKILEDCCHPHIVNLILASKEDSSPYLMMELLAMDLKVYITKRRRRDIFNRAKDIFDPFTPLEIVELITQVCDGMVYLSEEKNVSHRDLKPQNILVKEGAVLELQVGDFGLAKERQELTENTPNQGTTRYRAPEMTEPGRAQSDKIPKKSSMEADVYSFAVTCSIIWTGSEPFMDCSMTDLPALVKAGKRPDLQNCPPELSTLMQKCWHTDPAERPRFSEIYKQLRIIKANLLTAGIQNPPPAPPPTQPPPRPPPPPKEDRPLRVLVLGDWKLVKTITDIFLDSTPTQVKDHETLTESRSSSLPMCLYYNITLGSTNNLTDIRAFVKARNNMWHPKQVLELWDKGKHLRSHAPRLALFPRWTSRLHMVWYVCRTESDLPSTLMRKNYTEDQLYGLPVQVLVLTGATDTGDRSDQNETAVYTRLKFTLGSDWFPKADETTLKDLVLEVDLRDRDLKKNLWNTCFAVKTQVEIANAATVITGIREKLGPRGKSVTAGVATRRTKEFSLSQSAELMLNFLCTYWEIDSQNLVDIVNQVDQQNKRVRIEPHEFAIFCLQVAAIILFNASNPDYTHSRVPAEALKIEARACLDKYFVSSLSRAAYNKMTLEEMRCFLQKIFERQEVPTSLMQALSIRDSRRGDASLLTKLKEWFI